MRLRPMTVLYQAWCFFFFFLKNLWLHVPSRCTIELMVNNTGVTHRQLPRTTTTEVTWSSGILNNSIPRAWESPPSPLTPKQKGQKGYKCCTRKNHKKSKYHSMETWSLLAIVHQMFRQYTSPHGCYKLNIMYIKIIFKDNKLNATLLFISVNFNDHTIMWNSTLLL